MKTSTKWGLGLGALILAVGIAVSRAASAESPDTGKGLDKQTGVRHGIRYEGCDHFELVDPAAVEAWARDNALKFAKWAFKLDELKANPEPAVVEALTLLFPECPWPSPSSTTFGPNRIGWADAMILTKEAAVNLELSVEGDPTSVHAAGILARALAFGLRGER